MWMAGRVFGSHRRLARRRLWTRVVERVGV